MIQNAQLLAAYNGEKSNEEARKIPLGQKAGSSRRIVRSFIYNRTYVRFGAIMLVFAFMLIMMSALTGWNGEQEAHASTVGPTKHAQSFVIVGEGETLWSIAMEHKAPKKNIRDYIDETMHLNGLRDAELRTGQKLLLP